MRGASGKRAAICLATLGLLAVATSGRTEPVLPAEAQARLLGALSPLGPGLPIHGSWAMGDVALEPSRITIGLSSPGGTALLRLVPRGSSTAPAAQSTSFDVVVESPAPMPAGLEEAIRVVVEGLRQGDRGGFYQDRAGSPPEVSGADPAPAPDSAVPVTTTLLGGWLLALTMMCWGWRRSRPTALRELAPDVAAALVLGAVSLLLSAWLGPHTALHENARMARELGLAAGDVPIPRPMGGRLGLDRLVGWCLPLSLGAVTWATSLLAAEGAMWLYVLARALRASPIAAFVGGLFYVCLPVVVRFGASEDGFLVATDHLLAAAACLVLALRTRAGPWLVSAAAFAALGGVFRPSAFVAIVPLLLGVLLLADRGEARRWFTSRWMLGAAASWLLIAGPDLVPIVRALGGETALTIGWWSRPDLHSWPLVDPEVTPWWMVALALLSVVTVFRSEGGSRRALIWVASWLVVFSFVLSSDNGWPASLRYLTAYTWTLPLVIALGIGCLGPRGPGHLLTAALVVLAVLPTQTHSAWIGARYAQQREIDFQRDDIEPYLATLEPGVVLTPSPSLSGMSGTLVALPLRRRGWRVVGHEEAPRVLAAARKERPVLWYRGLACWARPERGGRVDAGLHPACEAMERAAPWRPALVTDLDPKSDADWILLGDGREPVEVGLFILP